MATIQYPKFVQTGTHTNVPACPSTTAVSFSVEFDTGNIPVVMANNTSTCGWAGATNITTAGFDLRAENSCTADWLAIYQSV